MNVLLVDGDEQFLGEMADAFRRAGLSVSATTDGDEALALAEQTPPALAVLTVEASPGKPSGFSLCRKFRQSDKFSELPIFILGAAVTQEVFDQHKRHNHPANEYFTKPVEASALVMSAAQYIDIGASEGGDASGESIADGVALDSLLSMDGFDDLEFDLDLDLDGVDIEPASSSAAQAPVEPHGAVTAFPGQPSPEALAASASADPSAQLRGNTDASASQNPDAAGQAQHDGGHAARTSDEAMAELASLRQQLIETQAEAAEFRTRSSVAERELEQTKASADGLRGRITSLEAQLAEAGSAATTSAAREALTLRTQLNRAEEELLSLKDEIFARDQRVSALEGQVEKRLSESEEMRSSLSSSQQSAKELSDKVRELVETGATRERVLSEKLAELAVVRTELEQTSAALASLRVESENSRQTWSAESDSLQSRLAEAIESERLAREKVEALNVAHDEQLQAAQSAFNEQKDELQSSQQRLSTLQQELEESQMIATEATERAEAATSAGEQVREQLQLAAARNEQLEADIHEARALAESLQQDLTARSAEAAELKVQLSAASEESAELQAQLSAAREESGELRSQLSAASEASAGYEAQLSAAREESAELRSQLSAASEASAGYEAQLSAAREESADLQAQLSAAREESGELRSQLSAASEASAELEAQLSAAREESAELRSQLSAANEASGELEAQLSAAREESGELEAQLSAAREESGELRSQLSAASEASAGYEAQLSAAREESGELRSQLSAATGDIESLGRSRDELREELAAALAEYEATKTLAQKAQHLQEIAEAEIEQVRRINDELSGRIIILSESVERGNQTGAVLRSTLQAFENAHVASQDAVSALQNELSMTRSQQVTLLEERRANGEYIDQLSEALLSAALLLEARPRSPEVEPIEADSSAALNVMSSALDALRSAQAEAGPHLRAVESSPVVDQGEGDIAITVVLDDQLSVEPRDTLDDVASVESAPAEEEEFELSYADADFLADEFGESDDDQPIDDLPLQEALTRVGAAPEAIGADEASPEAASDEEMFALDDVELVELESDLVDLDDI